MKLKEIKRIIGIIALVVLTAGIVGCSSDEAANQKTKLDPLPPPEIDTETKFGVDKNINMKTIDKYLFRDDVAYRDVRMLFDPAHYEDIGGERNLTRTIEGFKIVPFPYLSTVGNISVTGPRYTDNCLYEVVWNKDGTIASLKPNYMEAELIINELFPKDKAIFLMCGGSGYAGMTRELLKNLGYDENLIYNTGANWWYDGDYKKELIIYPEEADGDIIYATWRADYAYIEFDKLHKIGE